MNGIFAIIFISLILNHVWLKQHSLHSLMQVLQAVLKSIESRNYNLEKLALPVSFPKQAVLKELAELCAKGQLQPSALKSLCANLRIVQSEQALRDQQGLTVLLRLSLAALIALVAALLLDGGWLLDFRYNPPAILVLIGHIAILSLWLRGLAAHPLCAQPGLMQSYILAWIGQSHIGPWKQQLEMLEQNAWESGRSAVQARWQVLEDWQQSASREQGRKLKVSEELFSVVELLSSICFLAAACSLPLLNRFGG